MKKLILVIFVLFSFYNGEAQKYEVWLNTTNNPKVPKRYLGYFSDSLLNVHRGGSLMYSSLRSENINWNAIEDLKIRNGTRHDIAYSTAFVIGFGATYYLLLKNDRFVEKNDWGAPIKALLISLPVSAVCGWIGHKATGAKISIPLMGKTPKEKSRTLQEYMQVMSKKPTKKK